ncbi:AlpA family phage regulatory protein [Thalassotalea sp. G20_0]|uniref:helix-turn-helix transcriptional regulator n=1 Tax=Thalassotalea sp. G20_0 TaxID=2821093 RepID=UPI001ADC08D7|nr:AlpA family phage regulatory protein [Thalassotalea sp. G20_0]MBO9495094.1 AlpA family phage regulatory protein [Thalassotalea sp. G20_0]
MPHSTTPAKYLSRAQVMSRYAIGNTTLYSWINDEELKFPKGRQLGKRCVRWLESELEQWEAKREMAAA